MVRRIARAAPFAALAVGWLLTWLRVATPAALNDPWSLYWRGWQDQSLYVRSATALAHGDLAASAHYYPLLYPALGAPFVGLWPSQPFFVGNFACYLLAFAGFQRAAAAFDIRTWPASAIFAATTLVQFVFAKPWIEPWTTTASAALLWLAFGMATSLWTEAQPKRWHAAVLGIAVALTPFARPGDAPIALIAAMLGLAAMLRTRRNPSLPEEGVGGGDSLAASHSSTPRVLPLRGGAGLLLTALLAGGTAFALAAIPWLLIYGPAPSPYMLYSARYGFNVALLGWKAYVILVDPHAWFGGGTALLKVAPWLVLGAAGLVQACFIGPRDRRVPGIALCAAAALYSGLMLTYVDLLPSGLWRYNNIHYFKWLLPLFGLFAVRFVIVGVRRPAALAFVTPFLLLLFVKIVPVQVGADDPARLLIFSQPPGSVWGELYLATAWITDARGEQRNSFDYHQILDPTEVRAVALRRPFAGDERWIGSERVAAQLAGTDTGGYAPLYLTGPWPRRPLRRYGARVTLGWPSALF